MDMSYHGYALALKPEPSFPETVFADEMEQWLDIDNEMSAVHVAAAVYGAGTAMSTLSQAEAAKHWRQAPNWLHQLATQPSPQALATALAAMGLPQAAAFDAYKRFLPLHPVAATASALLLADADARSALSPATGLNRYGCAPYPQPGTVMLSSCTGNEPGKAGLSAVQRLKRRMMRAAWNNRFDQELAAVEAELARRIAALMGINPAPDTVIALTKSGSAAAHLTAGHFCPDDQPCLYLLVGQKETGREVPDAISIGAHVTVEDMFIRHDETGEAVAADVLVSRLEQRISTALHQGMQVVLQVVEGSKTGLTAPGIDGVARLRHRFPKGLHIVADFCQMRPGSAVKPYADLGAAIIATGSKFLGGPAFSGVAVIPGGKPAPIPGIGILARWEAALAECEGYAGLSARQIENGLKLFAETVRKACALKQGIMAVADQSPSHIATVHVTGRGGWMDMEWLKSLQGWLQADASALLPLTAGASDHAVMSRRCLVGQPVMVGNRAGLRLAINAARLVSLAEDGDAAARLTADVTAVLGKIDLVRNAL